MKRKISLLLIVTVLMTMAIPSVSLAETLGTSTVVDDEYYYEDFEGYTGASDWFNIDSTNGYYSTAGDLFSTYSDAENGTGLKIVNKTKSFKSFNGPRGNADTFFDVSTAQFEDAGTSLVFTADVLIKDSLSVTGNGLYINLHALKGEWQNLNSTLYSVSALPMYTKHWSKGPSFFVPIQANGNTQAGWTGGNATDFVTTTKTDGSTWVKLTSVVTYDKTNQKYVTTSYVDGKPIYNATSGEISKLEVPAPSDDVAARTRFGISVNYRANNTDTTKDEYAVVDNLAIFLCDTAVPQAGTVNGKTITIPFKNGKNFTDVSTAPAVVTNGYLNVDTVNNAKLKTEDGAEIDGAVITATQSEIKVTAPASVGSGKKVKVDLTGVEDIAGNQVGVDTSEYTVSGDVNIEEETPIPPTPPAPEVTGAPYYYQDFESFTGELSAIGYSSNDESVGTLKTSQKYGKGMYANYKSAEGTKNIKASNVVNITREQFEQNENAVIAFSYDMFIPSTLVGNRMVNTFINFYDGSGNNVKFVSIAPTLRSQLSDGTMHFMASDKTDDIDYATYNTDIKRFPSFGANWILYDANSKMSYSPPESEWVNALTLISYEDGYYVSRFFINGQPIINSVTQESAEMRIKDNGGSGKRSSIGFEIQERSGGSATDELGILFDNICIRMYDGITIDQYMQVPSNNNSMSIPIYNGYQFAGEGVPGYVKKAILKKTELKPQNIVVEKFSQDDKLLLNGTVIDGYMGTLNDNVIDLSNVEERQTGENLRITLKDIEDVDGRELLNSTIFVSADENFKGVIKSCFENINGDELVVASANSIPTEVSKLNMVLREVSEATITDGTVTYTAIDGIFDFTDNPLKANTTYSIKVDGSDYTTFKTVNNGVLVFSDITETSGNAEIRYVNTLNEDKTVYFAIMYFDSSNKLIKAVAEPKTAYKNSSDVMTMMIDSPSGAVYRKVVILDGLQTARPLSTMFVSPEQSGEQTSITAIKEIEISSFDNAKSATVKGVLNDKTRQRITAVLLDAAENVVYANDLYSANDGTYTFEINMPSTAETGNYNLYVVAAERVLANGTEVHYSKDSSSALALVNNATTAEAMAQVIKDNQADLEFYWDGYYTLFNGSDKLAVAALMLKEKNDLKAENGVGFITTDKQTAVDVFRKAVLVRAVTLGKVTDYLEIVPYFNELSTGVVYEWLDNNGGKEISSELRNKWKAGVLNRLKGASFASFADFLAKLKASLVFECIADSDGYGNIKNILSDYVSRGYISGLNSAYITNTVCSNLVDKVYTGFDYIQLITDINTYFNTPSGGGGNNGGFGGGGGGGVGAVFPGRAEAPTPIEGGANNGNGIKYDTFRDISDCWAKDIILELAKRNIISGIGDDFFAPERNITREEFAAIIVRMLGLSVVFEAEPPFDDVSKDDWCYDAVKIAYQHGIISGKSVSEFGKGEYVSRQDMAVMLKNALDVQKVIYEEGILNFTDSAEILDYAHTAVKALVGMKIINGYEDNTFRPIGLATRAEAAKVIYEVFKVLNV